jgi:hypothetical protein
MGELENKEETLPNKCDVVEQIHKTKDKTIIHYGRGRKTKRPKADEVILI